MIHKILVHKAERTLVALDAKGLCVLSASIQLGFGAQDGAKRREGDGCTPEGAYYICTKNSESKFYRSMGISYPSANDAAQAGLSDAAAQTIRMAQSERRRPPWDTPLGGYIMIHGQPEQPPALRDWTAGCIALENADMDLLFALTELGVDVEIRV